MARSIAWASLCLAMGAAAPSWASSEPPPYLGERLEYTASYEGLLSAGKEVSIADVVLSSDERSTRFNGETAYKMSVSASSEAYPDVDLMLRVRYSFSSLISEDLQRSLMFEQTENGRDRVHKVVWLDWQGHRVARLRTAEKGREIDSVEEGKASVALSPSLLEQLGVRAEAADYEAKLVEADPLPDRLLDRLSFMYALRTQDFSDGDSLQVPVTDGSKLLEYRVEVIGSESIRAAGRTWKTRHLRIFAFEMDEQGKGKGEPEHEPVDVWLALDEARTPVRFASERNLGRFDVRLRTASKAVAARGVRRSGRLAGLSYP
jgi:hypothetical protein